MTDYSRFSTRKRIGIDAGHRVPDHGSKCFRIHGHRYEVEAEVVGTLQVEGEERGMTMDFGFIKKYMMEEIHDPCDHKLILAWNDPIISDLAIEGSVAIRVGATAVGTFPTGIDIYCVESSPTAENLARHWFERLGPRITKHTDGEAFLKSITVWETPTSVAKYPAD